MCKFLFCAGSIYAVHIPTGKPLPSVAAGVKINLSEKRWG
ncbi:hypothetical protein ApDm4_2625 [Acetobacter pomorum]|nr:hypothetical protein ApDm4_2625 [Acetobacter pomorum]